MPTGFRSQPINYATTEVFSDHMCEMQFFGVSGYEVENLLAEGAESFDEKQTMVHPSLVVPIDMNISQTSATEAEMLNVASV